MTNIWEHAVANIKAELEQSLAVLRNENKLLELQRLEQRTNYDIEMNVRNGLHFRNRKLFSAYDGRKEGEPPYTHIGFLS